MTKEQIQDLVEKYDLLFPFDNWYEVTANFENHLKDKASGRHLFPGTDYAVWYGRPIKAPHKGKHSKRNMKGLGKVAVLDHKLDGMNFRWLFGHNSEVKASGNKDKGQVLAHAGNTGFTIPAPTAASPYSGTHVHLGLKINGKWVDPQPWVRAMYDHLERKLAEASKPTYEDLESKILALEAQNKALVRQLEGIQSDINNESEVEVSEPQILDINQISMETTKTISEKMVDGGKYIVFAQPIGALLGLALAQVMGWSAVDQVAVSVAGVTAITNLLLIILNHKFKFM